MNNAFGHQCIDRLIKSNNVVIRTEAAAYCLSFNYNVDYAVSVLQEIADNPNNGILRKINVFADYDIVSVVAEKYKLLNLVVTSEMIDRDNIDSTMDSVMFINLIQNIELSNVSLHDIEVLCNMKKIVDARESNSGEVV